MEKYHKVSAARSAAFSASTDRQSSGTDSLRPGQKASRYDKPSSATRTSITKTAHPDKKKRPSPALAGEGARTASRRPVPATGEKTAVGVVPPRRSEKRRQVSAIPIRRRQPKPATASGPVSGPERLQKVLAQAGIASRRHAEELIQEGAITVNGKTAELGCKVDPAVDVIKINGKPIRIVAEQKAYLVLNKPRGFITTTSDPEARDTVMGLLKGIKLKVKPVGRLDIQTEGLLIFTNDGDLINAVTHPARGLPKTYKVKVDGVMDEMDFEKLRHGVRLVDGLTAPAIVKPLKKTATNSWVEITIHEGRNRQVRRMCEHLGHSVLKLKRMSVGPISLGQLPLGAWRYLTPREVELLKQAVS